MRPWSAFIATVTLCALALAGAPAQAAPPAAAAAVAPAAAAAAPAALVQAAAATSGRQTAFDREMLTYMNQARSMVGAPALQEATGLVNVAVNWSTLMSNGHTGYNLEHNPDAWNEVAANGASNRTFWGENVAWSSSTGTSARVIFDAYMNSPGHRANILNASFRYVGVGTVTGDRGLWNTQQFTDNVQPGQVVSEPAPPAPIRDGEFILAEGGSQVFRVVGGAPLYVSSWAPFGGQQAVRVVPLAQFNALRAVPADGTFIAAGGSAYRIAGGAPVYISSWAPFGGAQSYTVVDPAVVNNAGAGGVWDRLRPVPADGTFIAAGGSAYRIAGGAPIYVSSWAPFGGGQPYTVVDPAAVNNAGAGGVWNRLRAVPTDGTFIAAGGSAYRIAGGAPIYISSWAPFGGAQSYTVVDPAAVNNAGAGGVWNRLRAVPADGTFIAAGGSAYRIAGGAPIYVSGWGPFGGAQSYTVVDPAAVNNAGAGGVWNRLRAFPADGTFIAAGGAVYRVVGGAPLYVSNWAAVGGVQPYTVVDPGAADLAGQSGGWRFLSWYPAENTLFSTVTGKVYIVQGGRAIHVTDWAHVGGWRSTFLIDTAAVDRAGTGGAYNHLRA